MRIVLVCPYDLARKGGVQRHVLSLKAEFQRLGHEVLAVAPLSGPAPDDTVLGLGRFRRISFAGTAFEVAKAGTDDLDRLDHHLRQWPPDIIHYHNIWVPVLPWQIFRHVRCAAVATFHDTPPPGITGAILRTIFKGLSRYLLPRLDGAIAVSPAPMAHLRPGANGVMPLILPPAIDLSRQLAIEKKPQDGPPIVLFVGRFEPRKGIGVLLQAWQQIVSRDPARFQGEDAPQLIVAGGGELEPLVLEAQKTLGREVLRHLPAPSDDDVLELMAKAALCVSPAIYGESFGLVLAEALATGTPVIGAANAGYVNVLTGEGASLLVPPGDAGALADKITGLLDDPQQRLKLGAWGRSHARQFDVSAVAPAILDLYRGAIARQIRHPATCS
jgi:phosphatidylinositol alpha-mannosyltransferase